MRKVSNRENIVGCQNLMLQSSRRKKLLSAKLLHHAGVEAHRVTDRHGEFVRTGQDDDAFVHVVPKLWIVEPDNAPEGSIPYPVFTEAQFLQRFIVGPSVLETGNGLVHAIARAVILTDRRKIIVWRPDGFYVGGAADVLISWTFNRENTREWEYEHFEVIAPSEWQQKFEIIQL